MVHLQICEGLDQVVGDANREKLTNFENMKVLEISNYV